jgi:RNA exonuclease NGL2
MLDEGKKVEVVEHLRPAEISALGEGLPRKGICASDHLAMGCGIIW